jgi:hypothetical protein
MKKLKTTFTALLLAGSLLLSTGTAGASKLQTTDEPFTTQSIIADPGTGGGGK